MTYKTIGTLFGLSTLTLAPFLAFLWVGFTPPALIITPLLMFLSFKIGKEIYELAPEAESTYVETLESFVAATVVLVVLSSIGLQVYDWLK